MLDIQKKQILYTVIHDYILSASPVGSHAIAQKKNVGYSPATIRSVMSELEDRGFLKRSHASSGRIPTDSGYRFYVDELMQVHPLSSKEKQTIQQSVESGISPIDQTIQQACQIVSLHADQISFGTLPQNKNSTMHTTGLSRAFRSLKSIGIETMEKLIKTFEEKTLMLKILHEAMEKPGVKILIGDEVEAPEINGLTLITSTYNDAEGNKGYLGVLGPTRINYAKIVPLVEFTTKIVTQTLSEN